MRLQPNDTASSAINAALPRLAPGESDHVIDAMLRERCPEFMAHWSWPYVRHPLFSMFGYRRAMRLHKDVEEMDGRDAFKHVGQRLRLKTEVHGLDNIPATGPTIIVCNHPTGLADGIAMQAAIEARRPDYKFFANADALRISPRFEDIIIPVEWDADTGEMASSRRTIKDMMTLFDAGGCIIIFPSGKPMLPHGLGFREQPWRSSFLRLARRNKAVIVPTRLELAPSLAFWAFCRTHLNLRYLSLFRELISKQGRTATISCLPAITPQDLASMDNETALSHIRTAVLEE